MNTLKDVLNNPVIISTILSWLIAQFLKTLIHTIMNKTFDPERLVGTGGMPSSHSATVCGLATSVFFIEGGGSTFFAIAAALAIIVMYDAMGLRRQAGKQARAINEMMDAFAKMNETDSCLDSDEKLKELVGHTPTQVVCGALLGAIIALIVCNIFAA